MNLLFIPLGRFWNLTGVKPLLIPELKNSIISEFLWEPTELRDPWKHPGSIWRQKCHPWDQDVTRNGGQGVSQFFPFPQDLGETTPGTSMILFPKFVAAFFPPALNPNRSFFSSRWNWEWEGETIYSRLVLPLIRAGALN